MNITLQLKVMAIRLPWLLEVNKINNCATGIVVLYKWRQYMYTEFVYSLEQYHAGINELQYETRIFILLLYRSIIRFNTHAWSRCMCRYQKTSENLFKYKDKHIKVRKQSTDEHLNGTLHLLYDTFVITIYISQLGELQDSIFVSFCPCLIQTFIKPTLYLQEFQENFKNELAHFCGNLGLS